MLSLEEANAVCEYANNASGDQAIRDRLCSIVPPPPPGTASTVRSSVAAPVAATTATAPLSASSNTATNPEAGAQSEGVEGGSASDPNLQRSMGLQQYSVSDGSLGDVLSTLFKEADKEEKVKLRNSAVSKGLPKKALSPCLLV